MKIKSLTATFGKLEKARLEPGEGLNLIYAPNEGGKSTWAAFWKAMLYGIDTRDRDKKGYLADKNHYQPWSGVPMEGEMELEWKGRNITIRRGPRGNTPFGSFSAVYTGTEEPVPELTGANCGEMLTGVGAAVFSRSAFLGADNLSLTSTPELERRIAALVSSGEEDVSFTQVQSRLKEWLNKRRVNKSVGEIPRLESELSQAREALNQMDEVTAQVAQLEETRQTLEEQSRALVEEQLIHRLLARTALEKKLSGLEQQQTLLAQQKRQLTEEEALHHRLASQELNRRYTLASRELDSAREQLESLHRESIRYGTLPDKDLLKKAQGELQYLKVLDEEIKAGEEALQEAEEAYVQAQIAAQDERFQGLSADEALQRGERDSAAYRAAMDKSSKRKRRSLLLFGVGLVALLPLVLFAPWPWLGPAIFVLCDILSFLSHTGGKQAAAEGKLLLSRYRAERPEEMIQITQHYRERIEVAEQAAQQTKTIRGTLNDRKARRDNSWSDLLDFVHTFSPEVQNAFGCSAALSRALNLDHELAAAKDRVEERRRRLEDLAAQGGQLDDTPQTLPTPQRSLSETREALAETNRQLEQVTQTLNQLRGQLDAMTVSSTQAPAHEPLSAPSHTPEETDRALAEVQLRLEQVIAQLNQARGKLRAMGDPAVLSARLEELADTLARRNLEYDALSLAMDTLQQANARLQERFSPQLNQLAGEYMARLTDHKYASVSLTRELDGSVRESGEVLPHSALYLSRGTADQLYLSVRLAVCRLCLPDRPPIFLDDALAAFDDQRLRLALGLLQELGKEQQLLLFSCHTREQELLRSVPGVTLLSL